MDPMSGFDIRLVFTLQPTHSTLQYKRKDAFTSEMSFLALNPCTDASILVYKFRPERTGFNMYAVYATAINFSCIITLH